MSDLQASSGAGNTPADNAPAPAVQPKPARAPKAPRRRPSEAPGAAAGGRGAGCLGALFNLLTVTLVLASCLVVALVALVFQYPSTLSAIPGAGRFVPGTDLPIAQGLNSPTPTASGPGGGLGFPTLPPVWTPTDTPTITPTPQPGTPTPEPSGTLAVPTYTDTATATATATATSPSPTPTRKGPTSTPPATRSVQAYTLQAGSPTYLANFINDSGCNWFGIVGRAFGLDGNPVINLTVHLEGGGINVDVVTGSGPTAIGPGSYEIPISDHPIDTTDVYKTQLRNNSGTPLSAIYSLRTYGDCSKNLIMVNFVQNH